MRCRVREEMLAIEPLDDLEREHLADAVSWLDSGADIYRTAKPATPPKHLVAYFVVVDRDCVLLVDHKDAGLWLPPGGHVELDEHPRDTVRREFFEELGIEAPHPIGAPLMLTRSTTVGRSAGHVDVSLWYALSADRERLIDYDQCEFNTVRWFTFAEVPFDRSEPHLKRFLRKLERQRQ
jgi:8-oxo-dGTP diphosphatase